MGQTVALIGYGTAALNAAIALRCAGFTGTISVFSDTSEPPYSPTLISYYAGGFIERKECFVWDANELAMLDLNLEAGSSVLELDVASHLVKTKTGEFSYDKCLIASGSKPNTGGFPELAGFEPLHLRTLADADKLQKALCTPDVRVLVSGTSMIALKGVEACLGRGADVTLLGRSAHILRTTAFTQTAQRFEQALVEQGVKLRLEQTVEAAKRADKGAVEVTFSNGDHELFNTVLVAHGMHPALGFVTDNARELGEGLLVDEHMRTKMQDVFAAGDVARVPDLVESKTHIAALWKSACLQGACAGRAMAAELAGRPLGADAVYPGAVRSNTIAVRKATLISGGVVAISDNDEFSCTERDGIFVATLIRDGHLVGYNVFDAQCDPTRPTFDIAGEYQNRLVRQLTLA